MPPYLLHGLAFLTTNLLARVAHPFAFVWLRRIEPANVGRYLSDQFFVDPLNGELCVLYDRDFDLFWNLKQNRMGEAKTQVQIGALNCSLETDPFDLKLLAEALAHALHHVVHERPGQTVQRSRGTRRERARLCCCRFCPKCLAAASSSTFLSVLPPRRHRHCQC